MKSVILFRHGNASFDRMFLNDHERTLERQGVKDAEKMDFSEIESAHEEVPFKLRKA